MNFNPESVLELLKQCPAYQPSPLLDCPGLADELGIRQLWVKDERNRMGVGSFKALGGALAVYRLLQRNRDQTFCCASAGNHGISVAAGAQAFGAESVIVLAETVSTDFEERLLSFGARVVRHGETYEESVAFATHESGRRGWTLVADSSWPNYREIPGWIMEGYTILAWEMVSNFRAGNAWPTHVFLQAGVGGLAGALTSEIRRSWDTQPQIIVVEPEFAPCLKVSMEQGSLTTVQGPNSIMGRLDCKEPSLIAFEILKEKADHFVTVTDLETQHTCTKLKEHGLATTPSGGAGLSAVIKWRARLGNQARVLAILSETGEPGS